MDARRRRRRVDHARHATVPAPVDRRDDERIVGDVLRDAAVLRRVDELLDLARHRRVELRVLRPTGVERGRRERALELDLGAGRGSVIPKPGSETSSRRLPNFSPAVCGTSLRASVSKSPSSPVVNEKRK